MPKNFSWALTRKRTLLAEPEGTASPFSTRLTLQMDFSGAKVGRIAFDEAIGRGDSASLERAVALYRGALLQGCDEAWVLPEREDRAQALLAAQARWGRPEASSSRTATLGAAATAVAEEPVARPVNSRKEPSP